MHIPVALARVTDPLRRHRWRTGFGIVVLALVAYGVVRASRPKAPEYITAPVLRSDITRTVEAVGTVISEKDLKLQFPVTGIVAQILVKEGDQVKAGQKLVALRSADLAASVAVQVANLRSAQAQLQAMVEGSRPEDIAIAEADVANKQAALNAAQETLRNTEETLRISEEKMKALEQEAITSLSGQVTIARSTAIEQLTIGQSALSSFDDVFANNDLQDAVIKGDSGTFESIRLLRQSAGDEVRARIVSAAGVTGFTDTLALMLSARAMLANAGFAMSQALDFVSSLPTSGYFTSSSKETYRSSLDTQWRKIQTTLWDLDAASKTLSDAAASYTTKIAAEKGTYNSTLGTRDRAKADIRTYQTAVQTAQAQLSLKRAPSRSTDIAAAQARVQQAAADVQRAQAQFSNTVLTAPIDGTITSVHIKMGEALPAGPAIDMLGSSPYRIEMFVSEIDIPTVQLSQSGSVELDAFKGTDFALHVSQIDTAATDKDGVPKYRIKLDFVYPHEELKVGMTGDARIVTGERTDVLHVPLRAVLRDKQGRTIVRVLDADKHAEERNVATGMEGETGDIEITSGLQEGETIIVLEKT